jgi:L-aspartate oxidase
MRRESRGGHFRADHASEVAALAQRTMTTLAAAREVAEKLTERPMRRAAQAMIA